MTRTKVFLAAFIALSIVGMVYAGGGSQSGGGTASSSSGRRTGIRLQLLEGGEVGFAEQIAQFEKENNASVVLDLVQWDQSAMKYALSYAAGRAPDVVNLSDWSIRGDILNNRLYPLNEFV